MCVWSFLPRSRFVLSFFFLFVCCCCFIILSAWKSFFDAFVCVCVCVLLPVFLFSVSVIHGGDVTREFDWRRQVDGRGVVW